MRDGAVPAPTFRLRRPTAWHPGRYARLELRFHNLGLPISVYCDTELVGDGEIALAPDEVHLEGTSSPATGPARPLSWADVSRDVLVPELTTGRLRSVTLSWRVTTYHADGSAAATSPLRPARFELAETD